MKPHEWIEQCIRDDLEINPGQDPAAAAKRLSATLPRGVLDANGS
jgi:hypothetical protein